MQRPVLLVALTQVLVCAGASAAPPARPARTAAPPHAAGAAAHKASSSRPRPPAAAAHAAEAPARAPTPKPAPPELLLTFDDGPSLERTPKVLETLEKHHLHAVFFVNGVHFQGESPAARKARALLREVVARGHAVGNHTIHHYFLCGRVWSTIAEQEIEGNARLIEQAIGRRPELYRTPYGSHCPTLGATLKRLGVKHTSWDIDPEDWKVQNTARVRDYIIDQLRRFRSGREILLMHDIHQCSVEALPQILDWLDGENAARVKRGEPPIRIIDPTYLLPPRPVVPPLLDDVGHILIEQLHVPDPARLLALLTGQTLRS